MSRSPSFWNSEGLMSEDRRCQSQAVRHNAVARTDVVGATAGACIANNGSRGLAIGKVLDLDLLLNNKSKSPVMFRSKVKDSRHRSTCPCVLIFFLCFTSFVSPCTFILYNQPGGCTSLKTHLNVRDCGNRGSTSATSQNVISRSGHRCLQGIWTCSYRCDSIRGYLR